MPVGGVVDEAHDAEDALAVDDALAGADGVAGELDALVGRAARRVAVTVGGHEPASLPGRAASVAGRLEALDDAGVVPAAAGHVVLDGADLAAAVGDRLGGAALERVDRARGLHAACCGGDEGDAALDCELAQVALLARCRWRSGGWLVGGDRSWPRPGAARGAVKPWSVRTREATRRAGLDGPRARRARLAGQDRAPGAARRLSRPRCRPIGVPERTAYTLPLSSRSGHRRLAGAAGARCPVPAPGARHAPRIGLLEARATARPPARGAADQRAEAAVGRSGAGRSAATLRAPFADRHPGRDVGVDVGEVVRAERVGHHAASSPKRRRSSARSRRKSSPRAV